MSKDYARPIRAEFIGKCYDHDPRHFRFMRTCSGFYPCEDSHRGDRAVFGATIIIAAIFAGLFVINYLLGVRV
jgi:hypothetical protein